MLEIDGPELTLVCCLGCLCDRRHFRKAGTFRDLRSFKRRVIKMSKRRSFNGFKSFKNLEKC